MVELLIVGLLYFFVLKTNKSRRWKHIFILLLTVNIIVSSLLWWAIWVASTTPSGGVAGIVLFPVASGLSILNTIVVVIYLIKQHPQGWAKVIIYIYFIYLAYTFLQAGRIIHLLLN